MKTPEELAEEYVHAWWGPREDNMTLATRQSFLAGYQAAKEHAHAELEEADVEIDRLQTKLSDAGILTTEHLIDASKMVDVSSSVPLNNWISVKDRLPEKDSTVLIYTEAHDTYMAKIYKDSEAWPISNSCGCCGREERFTHWMPLPQPPKEDK